VIDFLASREASAFANAIAIITVIVVVGRFAWPSMVRVLAKINKVSNDTQRKQYLKNIIEAKNISQDKSIIVEKIVVSSIAHFFAFIILTNLVALTFLSAYNRGYLEGCSEHSKWCLSPEVTVQNMIDIITPVIVSGLAVFVSWIISIRRTGKLRNWQQARKAALIGYVKLRSQR
jgi:cytochrome b